MTTAIAKRQNGNSPAFFGSVVDNIVHHSLHGLLDNNFWDTPAGFTSARVPVNIRERDEQYEMDVIAPGCRKEDLTVNVENNTLTIFFSQKDDRKNEDKKTRWARNEYTLKPFTRSFTMDDTVDLNRMSATYKDGILHMVLPKNEKAQRLVKNIQVK